MRTSKIYETVESVAKTNTGCDSCGERIYMGDPITHIATDYGWFQYCSICNGEG